jgi:hypothetical protein
VAASADSPDVDLLYEVAEATLRYMNSGPPLLLVVVYVFIAGIPLTLLHELGHAVAARLLLGADVEISVGSAGKLAALQLGQVSATINALSLPGRAAGSATFDDSRASARDAFWIAIAGPLASLAGTAATAMLLSNAPSTGIVHDLLWAALPVGVFGVLNLVPYEFKEDRDGPALRTDGRLALDAVKVTRALR